MMNFQIKLRHGRGFFEPVGPSFARAKKWKLSIEGTQIEFRAPKHRPMVKSDKAGYPERSYRYADKMFFKSQNTEVVVADLWKSVSLFYHDWAFNGPWFTGCLAQVSMSLFIFKSKQPNKNVSFFHPRAFEQTIGDFLSNRYSKDKDEGQHVYRAPLNWLPIKNLPVVAARLEVIADGSITPYSKDEYLFFPIDDQHFITMIFYPSRDVNGTEAEIDKIIGYKNLGELIDNIIGSLKITLSPEAQAQQERALEGLENKSLIKSFPPMKWTKSIHDAVVSEDRRLDNS